MDLNVLKSRIDELLKIQYASRGDGYARASQLLQGAITVISAVHGPESHQVTTLRDNAKKSFEMRLDSHVYFAAHGAVENLKAELDAGLIGSLQKRLQGEVLTDFIQLAMSVLDQSGDGAKNVAAVLVAAAFEDVIRRMGSTLAGVVGHDDLEDIIGALKQKGVLVAPQLGIALGYLNFRNRALHANWDQIQLETVHSALGFVEQLLLKHFQ